MKKKLVLCLVVIISIFMVAGCSTEKQEKKEVKEEKKTTKINKVEDKKEVYIKYVQELRKVKETTEDLPFTIEVLYEKMDDEVRYQVIIDNPSSDITDIQAIAIHDRQTDDVFPSVGIFDDKVDLKQEQTPSGVILVGYIPYEGEIENFECEMKVLVKYNIGEEQYTSYYVTKK